MKFNVRDLGGIEGYLGLDKGVDSNLKRYVVETASYNLSTAISSNLVNVMAIRLMGFGVLELSILTISRMLFVTLGSIVALPLIYRFREHRLKLWLVFGGLNRIGWALSIYSSTTTSSKLRSSSSTSVSCSSLWSRSWDSLYRHQCFASPRPPRLRGLNSGDGG